MFTNFFVSVPYEITLLSNLSKFTSDQRSVSVPYEITLLSNDVRYDKSFNLGFSTL